MDNNDSVADNAARDEYGVSALTPPEIVTALDRYIVGQDAAKKAVAIALRNRWRRMRLPEYLIEEVIPKNILMMGPTGVGKTEIARRLASLAQAPFVKVEATKFTEVGYVGRDVESMIRDLAEVAIQMVRLEKSKGLEPEARLRALDKLVDKLAPVPQRKVDFTAAPDGSVSQAEPQQIDRVRERIRKQIIDGELDDQEVDIEVTEAGNDMLRVFSNQGMEEMGVNFQQILGNIFPQRKQKKSVKVREALDRLAAEEMSNLIDMDAITRQALHRVETSGIVFIDELDKVCGKGHETTGPDVSREGVQRDILPIIEGSTVVTKHGHVRTDHILFIAAGAFHVAKPADLIPELQGRLPIRVELGSLSVDDFKRILTEPRNALVTQYMELMKTESVNLRFTEDGVNEIAESAFAVNESTENIGARRLYTILEKVLEDVSFHAADIKLGEVVVDAEYVKQRLKDILEDRDLSRYIL